MTVTVHLQDHPPKQCSRSNRRCVWAAFPSGYVAAIGTRKLLGVGGSFDVQKDYKAGGVDLIYERPLVGGSQGVTTQIGWTRLDGGDFITTLPKQDVMMVEAGYHLAKGRFTPFVQYSNRNFDLDSVPDPDAFQVGIACWLKGHARNFKASIGQQHTSGQPRRLQGLVQLQIFSY